ncbi:MAG: hypothetical protein ABW321_29600 [Polyangiales bacterium]
MTSDIGPQQFHLVLMDIATAAAARANGVEETIDPATYVPGGIRTAWHERKDNRDLCQRVNALATAGSTSLSQVPADKLSALAEQYGVPLRAEDAQRIADYFQNKRDAVLTYNR